MFGTIVGRNLGHLVNGVQAALESAAREAIIRGIAQKKAPQEPDIVACLVLYASREISSLLERVLAPNGIDISLVSVYCHQTPRVEYKVPSKGYCELGDLLLAHVHNSGTQQRRNAMLFQAKMITRNPYTLPKSEHHQQVLYSQWPDFKYKKSAILKNEPRSVMPKGMHPGAKYLAIDHALSGKITPAIAALSQPLAFSVSMPYTRLLGYKPLSLEVVEFLLCQTGRPFLGRARAEQGIGWSRIVWDLIRNSINKAVIRKNSGLNEPRRVTGDPTRLDGSCFAMRSVPSMRSSVLEELGVELSDIFLGPGDEPPAPDNRRDLPPDDSGISLVLIETTERGVRAQSNKSLQ